jgi:hypothetical protein
MKKSILVAAVITLVTGTANAATITMGGQYGNLNGGVNCGTGSHSQFLGGSVAEFNFDGLNGSSAYTPCPGSGPDANFVNYGAIATTRFNVGGGFGNISFSHSAMSAGDIVRGRLNGQSGAPWADNTPYLVIPGLNQNINNRLTLNLTGLTTQANYFGMYFGSVDTYNNLIFSMSDSSTIHLTGAAIAAALTAAPNGGQFSTSSNVFVDFFSVGATINSITFYSTQRALEVDNFAFGSVPAPGALALLGLGLLGLGAFRRKKAA